MYLALECSQPPYFTHAKEEASKASAKHAGVGVRFASEVSKKNRVCRHLSKKVNVLGFSLCYCIDWMKI